MDPFFGPSLHRLLFEKINAVQNNFNYQAQCPDPKHHSDYFEKQMIRFINDIISPSQFSLSVLTQRKIDDQIHHKNAAD